MVVCEIGFEDRRAKNPFSLTHRLWLMELLIRQVEEDACNACNGERRLKGRR